MSMVTEGALTHNFRSRRLVEVEEQFEDDGPLEEDIGFGDVELPEDYVLSIER